MLLTDFDFVCIFIGFAHLTESRILVVSEYDDGPLVLDHADDESQEQVVQVQPTIQPQPIITDFTPKRIHNSKRTIVQYGRHIYHLDNKEDIRELRSKLKPASISYDYVDLNELGRSSASKNDIIDYLKDLFIVSDKPLRFCSGRQCGDLRKSSKKYKKHEDENWKHKKKQKPLGIIKRFQIVDNRHHKTRKPKYVSEEYHEKKKTSKKNKKYSSESVESEHTSSHKKNKRITKSSEETDLNKSSDEVDSASASFEKWKNSDEDSKSDEDYSKKKPKKKKKRHYYEASDDTNRKTIPVEDTYFTQGNKIYHSSGKIKKKHDDFDKRRRLEHFFPKRYHWDPSEFHDLGYYWFNGPKGRYPSPQPLTI